MLHRLESEFCGIHFQNVLGDLPPYQTIAALKICTKIKRNFNIVQLTIFGKIPNFTPSLMQEGLECYYQRIHFINILGACELPTF